MTPDAGVLKVRLMMERLISERESMKALNEWRASRGESQAYGEESFLTNAAEFAELIPLLRGKE